MLQVLRQAIPLLIQGVDNGESKHKSVLASIYRSLCNTVAKATARLQEATQFCEKAVNLSADSSNAHNSLGAVLMQRGENREAIGAFKRALALDKSSTMAAYNLALVYITTGDDALAIQSLSRVLATDSSHGPAMEQLQLLQGNKS